MNGHKSIHAEPVAWQCAHCGGCDKLCSHGRKDRPLFPAPDSAQSNREPVTTLPSSTRYTVEVEGQARTYWDNVHDAMTNAQLAVYAGVDATTRAIDDLRSGRIAEWSYGFSAVRIYPPQNITSQHRECQWHPEDDENMPGTWRSDCGVLWTFTDGGPKENDMRFCCGCGAKLREKNGGAT